MKTLARAMRWWKPQAVAMLCAFAAAVSSHAASPPSPTPAAARADDHARIAELRREIARHDDLYFRQAAPEISDAAYDTLKTELRRLEAAYPDFHDKDATAPAAVGDDRVEDFPKHRHRSPMAGLDKAFSDEELTAFHARAARALDHDDIVYRIEPKFDGIAVSLTYEDGRLTRAATRGNGIEGDDITDNVRALCAPPETLTVSAGADTPPALIEVRGEIFMRFAEFERINRERKAAGEPVFANPRNLVAGTVKLRDADALAGRRLELVCYGWGALEPAGSRPATLTGFHRRLSAWGLPTIAAPRTATGLPALKRAIEAARRQCESNGFPADGVVVKLERVADQDRLGAGPAGPRWAIARKWPAERAATRLTAITWQVGRTGALTPVAELEPVKLAGSTVARATLHHAGEIAALDLRIGDTVWIEKAGDIIPVLAEVDVTRRPAKSRPYATPTLCPACGSTLTVEGAARRCPAYDCAARTARRVEHFASPAGLKITGLGPATIALLVERELVRGPADLYALTVEELIGLPGLGKRSAEKLVAAIAASRSAEWPTMIRALGLPGVGARRAEALARAAGDWDALLAVDLATLQKAGFGEATAHALLTHLDEPAVRAELAALQATIE